MKTIYLVWSKWDSSFDSEEKLIFISEDRKTAEQFIKECKIVQNKLHKFEDKYSGLVLSCDIFGDEFRITPQYINEKCS